MLNLKPGDRKPQLRWRREPAATGLARVAQRYRGYELRSGGEILIRVGMARRAGCPDKYYWYGLERNTLREGLTFDSPEAAQSHAMEAARARKDDGK